ncbi:MAG: hypothetical protein DBO98_04485 [Candidatus Liberibacter europaeus]|nr:hypothetical protein [Candidatus Liberibacter europaeus]
MAKTTYTKQKTDNILTAYATGKTLVESCKAHGVKVMTFYEWLEKDHDSLKERYRLVKESHAESISAELYKIVHSAPTPEELEYPHLLKLRETRMNHLKWELEKRHPKQYGNHVTVTQNHMIDLAPAIKHLNDRQAQREAMKLIKSHHKSIEQAPEHTKTIEHKD